MIDSKNSIEDIKFSPKNFGLKLASCSCDGVVRIYEPDSIINLTSWR